MPHAILSGKKARGEGGGHFDGQKGATQHNDTQQKEPHNHEAQGKLKQKAGSDSMNCLTLAGSGGQGGEKGAFSLRKGRRLHLPPM